HLLLSSFCCSKSHLTSEGNKLEEIRIFYCNKNLACSSCNFIFSHCVIASPHRFPLLCVFYLGKIASSIYNFFSVEILIYRYAFLALSCFLNKLSLQSLVKSK